MKIMDKKNIGMFITFGLLTAGISALVKIITDNDL